MDTSKLKTYAPKARRDLISVVTRRAAKRDKLAQRIAQQGFEPVLEATAYSWSGG
jgi:hypothetical protein